MANKDTRLGKGLGALLGEYLEEEEAPETPDHTIAVEEIRPNPYQPRAEVGAGELGELVESIRENGLLQPLVVRPAPDGWELVAGERRWRALRQLGWDRAPAIVRELEDEQMLVLALVENLQRENLSPLEEARGYERLMEGFGLTQQQVAERVGKDRSTVANLLRLLKLGDDIHALIERGDLAAGHARALLGLEDAAQRRRLAAEVAEKGLSVRETERRVRRLREAGDEGSEEEEPSREPERDPVARRAEQVLERALGTGVSVRLRGTEKGEIGIAFHDSEEFRRLCGLLAGEEADELFD